MDRDVIRISIPDKEAFLPLLRLVLGGIAARRNMCFDDLDDIQLAVEDLVANRIPDGQQVTMTVDAVDDMCLDITLEGRIDEHLCERLQRPPEAETSGATAAALDTCRVVWALMDSVSVRKLPSGRSLVRMIKRCR